MNDQVNDASVEVEAAQMSKRLRRREEFSFVIGLVTFSAIELVRANFFNSAIGEWTLRGCFMPIAAITAIITMISSSSMQSSLKELGGPDIATDRTRCLQHFIKNKNAEGLRLISGI